MQVYMQESTRVGLYIQPQTRARLNLFKAQLALTRRCSTSQDDAVNALLDLAGVPNADDTTSEAELDPSRKTKAE